MILREAKPRIYTVQQQLFGDREGNQENAWASLRMTPIASEKFPVPKRASGQVSQRQSKLYQALRVSKFEELEHCIPVLATEFKLSEATLASALWLHTLSGAQ